MSLEIAKSRLQKALDLLVAERKRVGEEMVALEKLLRRPAAGAARGGAKKRASAKPAKAAATKKPLPRKKPKWSPAAREAARQRMKQYWASRKKASK